jgi:hypothetical protein
MPMAYRAGLSAVRSVASVITRSHALPVTRLPAWLIGHRLERERSQAGAHQARIALARLARSGCRR